MKKVLCVVQTLITIVALPCFAAAGQARHRVVAYVPNWIDVSSFSRTIDYAKLTHINIAFENPQSDEGDLSFNPRNRALISAARTNGVKVLISIGGGAASENQKLKERYFRLLSQTNRMAFAVRLARYVVDHGFDGLDVDIEGPSINEDYGDFIQELAAVLRSEGKLLTAALSKGYGGDKVPAAALAHFDFVNIMAYDTAGPWSPQRPGQHSSLEFATNSVAYWLSRGLPSGKAVLGVPFYGYGFGDAFRKHAYSYKEILAAHPGAENSDQAGNTIWYNGIPTIRAKARYVMEQQLGGMMIWSLDGDAPGDKSLLSIMHEAVNARESTR